MELPIKFSAETQVILEDVAGYQAMSPQERVEVLKRILREGRVPDQHLAARR